MSFNVGSLYHGFRLAELRRVDEIHSTGMLFSHEKSGARLLYLVSEDDNKVFSITFRTPPADSTGIPHILEHSVLCGSRKFPSKEPFVELAKGSLNTFLNAMTFPDKTMYPVASRNRRDFYNLMDVYLDAVFYPNIHSIPEIFMQEGWHYDLDREDGDLEYKGVVYNEMKGVFSTPESVLFRKIPESLFPDTIYRFESGGDPDKIPSLSHERFLRFHKEYYHPANSYIIVYGDGDVKGHLAFLDAYLGDFDRTRIDSAIGFQKPFSEPVYAEAAYPILPHEEEGEKTFLSLNFAAGDATNAELNLAFTILEYLLLETPAAPLRKKLMDTGLGKDVLGQYEREMLQPVFSVILKGSEEKHRDAFSETVLGTLEELAEKGIDKQLVKAAINIHEFKLREADFRSLPKGLIYGMTAMGSWLYKGDPFSGLQWEKPLGRVKAALENDYFEKLIKTRLIGNSHRSLLTVKPEKGLLAKREEEERRKLADYRKSLSGDELEQIMRETRVLKERQMKPDPARYTDKIPLLDLNSIERKAEKLPLEEKKGQGVKVIHHPVVTNGITYLHLLFDTRCVDQEDIPYLALLSRILGRIGTENYGYTELSNFINIHTGGINFSAEAYSLNDDADVFFPKLGVHARALSRNMGPAGEIIGEICGRTVFEDPKRLREIIQETKSRYEMSIYDQGHFITAGRLLTYYSRSACYSEALGGISFYRFISDLERDIDNRIDEVIARLSSVSRAVFSKRNLIMSVTAESEDYPLFTANLDRVLDAVPDEGTRQKKDYVFNGEKKNEALLTPGKVQYVAKGFNFRRLGYSYSGSLQVLRTIASLDYLWNRVRVQGGAYGGFARFARDGTMYFCSYRDPNLGKTLDVYDGAADYFRVFDAADREITKYIIGTVSRLDHPLTPSMKGEVAFDRYMRRISQDDIQKARDEVLDTNVRDIRETADLIEAVMKKDRYCVLGNESVIRKNEALFDSLVNVF